MREEEADKKRRMYMRDMGAVEEDERMEEGRRDMGEEEVGRERERCSRGGARRIEERN